MWLEVQSWRRVGVWMLRLKKFVLSSSFKNLPSKPCSDLFRSREQKSMLEARSSAWPGFLSPAGFLSPIQCKLGPLLSLCGFLSKLKTLFQRLVLWQALFAVVCFDRLSAMHFICNTSRDWDELTWLVKTVSEMPDLCATAHFQFLPLNVSRAAKQCGS